MLELSPITFSEAAAFVLKHHRHHKPPISHKFSIACAQGGEVVAVVIVGRPVSRHLDDGYTLEIVRLCSIGAPNACSKLAAAAWRVARGLGYRKLITYILDSETGVSYKAAGFKIVGTKPPGLK